MSLLNSFSLSRNSWRWAIFSRACSFDPLDSWRSSEVRHFVFNWFTSLEPIISPKFSIISVCCEATIKVQKLAPTYYTNYRISICNFDFRHCFALTLSPKTSLSFEMSWIMFSKTTFTPETGCSDFLTWITKVLAEVMDGSWDSAGLRLNSEFSTGVRGSFFSTIDFLDFLALEGRIKLTE